MRRIASALTIFAACTAATVRADDKAEPKQLQFEFRVVQKSADGKSTKVLAEPVVIATEGRKFTFVSGGEVLLSTTEKKAEFVPFGLMLEGTPSEVADGKLKLDIELKRVKWSKKPGGLARFDTQSTRVVGQVPLEKKIKLTLTGDKRTWTEMVVREVFPVQPK